MITIPFIVDAIVLALVIHWVFDFVLQSNWMASNKSNSLRALSGHVIVYTVGMMLLGFFVAGPTTTAVLIGAINGGTHFGVDFCTSKITSALWKKKDVHNFFVVIGFDQLIHTIILIATLSTLLPV